MTLIEICSKLLLAIV